MSVREVRGIIGYAVKCIICGRGPQPPADTKEEAELMAQQAGFVTFCAFAYVWVCGDCARRIHCLVERGTRRKAKGILVEGIVEFDARRAHHQPTEKSREE